MFINELNKDLNGRQLAIWLGKNEDGSPINMSEDMIKEYRELWISQATGNKIKSFVNSVTNRIKGGVKNVDDDTYKKRLDICNKCENRNTNWTCKLCGCNINVKARWSTEICPEKTEKYPNGRWELEVIKVKGEGCGCSK